MPSLTKRQLLFINRLMKEPMFKSGKFTISSKLKKKAKSATRKRLMTLPQKKALIKAIGKNKSMKPSSRKAAIRKIRAKKTRKS